jgi:hypothetical protein
MHVPAGWCVVVKLRPVEVPGDQAVRRGQHQQEAGHAVEPDVPEPLLLVHGAEQRQHPATGRARVGVALVRPVEDQCGDAGGDPGGAPRPSGGAVPATDDVRELRPPGTRVVERAAGQLVAQGEDRRGRALGPPDDHRAHPADDLS